MNNDSELTVQENMAEIMRLAEMDQAEIRRRQVRSVEHLQVQAAPEDK